MISGFLERNEVKIDGQYLKKLCYCLLLPYLIYNMPYSLLLFVNTKDTVQSILSVSVPPNDPTWFFFALFVVKLLMAVFARNRRVLLGLAVSIYCALEYGGVHLSTFLCVHAVLTGVIFYEFGSLYKLLYQSKILLLTLPIACLLIYRSVTNYGRYDMYWGQIDDPVWFICTTAVSSMAVLTICKYLMAKIPKFVCNTILYPLSRGTMVIVGTHYMLAHYANKYVFQTYDNLPAKLCYTLILLGMYWIFINLTFRRFPILYGKFKHK